MWSSRRKPSSAELAMLLDSFEKVRPLNSMEKFISQLLSAVTDGVDEANQHVNLDSFAVHLQTAKSLEKLLLIYEWQKAGGQQGLDRHIQGAEAQLLSLYQLIAKNGEFKVYTTGVDEDLANDLSTAITGLKIAHGADQLSSAEEILEKTKNIIAQLVGNKRIR